MDINVSESNNGKTAKNYILVDNSKFKMLQSILFAAAFFLFLIAFSLSFKNVYEQYSLIKAESEEIQSFLLGFVLLYGSISIITYLVKTVSLGAGLISSFSNKLTYVKNGVVLSAFFIIGIITSLVTLILGGNKVEMLLTIVSSLLMIIVIFLYFIFKKSQSAILVYVVSGLNGIYIIANFIYYIVNTKASGLNLLNGSMGLANIIVPLANLVVAALVFCQVYFLEKQNKKLI